jgi:hypothetical protein
MGKSTFRIYVAACARSRRLREELADSTRGDLRLVVFGLAMNAPDDRSRELLEYLYDNLQPNR